MSRVGSMSLTIIASTSRNCSQLCPLTMAVRSVNVRPFGLRQHISLRHRGPTCTAWTRVVTHGTRRAWARVEIPWIIASIGDVPCWSMSLTIIACTSRNCSQLCPFTVAVRSVNVRPFGHHRFYQQELQPALSLYNCCAICECPTFWSEPTHLTQTQGGG